MKIINCYTIDSCIYCEANVSSMAKTCPHCGHPYPAGKVSEYFDKLKQKKQQERRDFRNT